MDSPPAFRAALTMADETAARRLADLLSEIFDPTKTAVAAFEAARGWEISVHFSAPPDEAAVRAQIASVADAATAAAVTFEAIAAQDWVRASLEGLKPVAAGRFLVHGAHDRAGVRPNQTAIEIEAALAFGTGHHGTTRGCLLLLDAVLRGRAPRRILDLGTGTGVLAIAAAKTTRRRVLASDIDARAVAVARANARLNGAGPFVKMIHATDLAAPDFAAFGPFDLVLANILAAPLRRLATPIARHLTPGAHIILSGLLPAHANGVLASWRGHGVVLVRRIELEGWTSLLLRRSRRGLIQPWSGS